MKNIEEMSRKELYKIFENNSDLQNKFDDLKDSDKWFDYRDQIAEDFDLDLDDGSDEDEANRAADEWAMRKILKEETKK